MTSMPDEYQYLVARWRRASSSRCRWSSSSALACGDQPRRLLLALVAGGRGLLRAGTSVAIARDHWGFNARYVTGVGAPVRRSGRGARLLRRDPDLWPAHARGGAHDPPSGTAGAGGIPCLSTPSMASASVVAVVALELGCAAHRSAPRPAPTGSRWPSASASCSRSTGGSRSYGADRHLRPRGHHRLALPVGHPGRGLPVRVLAPHPHHARSGIPRPARAARVRHERRPARARGARAHGAVHGARAPGRVPRVRRWAGTAVTTSRLGPCSRPTTCSPSSSPP